MKMAFADGRQLCTKYVHDQSTHDRACAFLAKCSKDEDKEIVQGLADKGRLAHLIAFLGRGVDAHLHFAVMEDALMECGGYSKE